LFLTVTLHLTVYACWIGTNFRELELCEVGRNSEAREEVSPRLLLLRAFNRSTIALSPKCVGGEVFCPAGTVGLAHLGSLVLGGALAVG
jgi:hypothetical protein